MKLKDFFNFIRWKNCLIIALILLLIKFALFYRSNINFSLDNLHYILLVISVLCVAIAGYIINDIYDVEADRINKPNRLYVGKAIARSKAYNLFIAFNSVGLIIGMYLSYYVGHTAYFIIYVLTSLLLYQYAKHLKKMLLAGNFLVSFVVFLCIVMPLVFDVLPVTSDLNATKHIPIFKTVLLYATFGFAVTLIREIVKDMEDTKGDDEIGARSLPLVYGEAATKKIVFGLVTFVVLALVYLSYRLRTDHLYAALFSVVLVIIPMIYFAIYLNKAQSTEGYHRSSGLLKIIMLMGILTMAFL